MRECKESFASGKTRYEVITFYLLKKSETMSEKILKSTEAKENQDRYKFR